MPVSEIGNIPSIMFQVRHIQPKSIVDLGCGFGKYGVLCREVLDAVHGRISRFDWQHNIFGVEAWGKYANPCWEAYDSVSVMDFVPAYKTFHDYELILAVDVMEHLPKEQAIEIIDSLVANNRYVIVSVPIGECPQGAVFGNPYEEHKAAWYPEDFDFFTCQKQKIHQDTCVVVKLWK